MCTYDEKPNISFEELLQNIKEVRVQESARLLNSRSTPRTTDRHGHSDRRTGGAIEEKLQALRESSSTIKTRSSGDTFGMSAPVS